jgi:hypothetical protein
MLVSARQHGEGVLPCRTEQVCGMAQPLLAVLTGRRCYLLLWLQLLGFVWALAHKYIYMTQVQQCSFLQQTGV